MTSYQLWLDNIKDILVPHIHKGLSEAYNSVRRLTNGHKTLMSFQVVLAGLPDLSQSKIMADYDVLVAQLAKHHYTREWFDEMVSNAIRDYARAALTSQGLNCDNMNMEMLEIPSGPEFVQRAYIQAGREIWMRPELFSHKVTSDIQQRNNKEIYSIIQIAVEAALRESVNLNKIITAVRTGQIPNAAHQHRVPTLKARFNQMNGGRTLLDDDSDGSGSEDEAVSAVKEPVRPAIVAHKQKYDEDAIVQAAINSLGPPSLPREPSTPSTIDDDDRAPDEETLPTGDLVIDFGPAEQKDDDLITVHTVHTVIDNKKQPAPKPTKTIKVVKIPAKNITHKALSDTETCSTSHTSRTARTARTVQPAQSVQPAQQPQPSQPIITTDVLTESVYDAYDVADVQAAPAPMATAPQQTAPDSDTDIILSHAGRGDRRPSEPAPAPEDRELNVDEVMTFSIDRSGCKEVSRDKKGKGKSKGNKAGKNDELVIDMVSGGGDNEDNEDNEDNDETATTATKDTESKTIVTLQTHEEALADRVARLRRRKNDGVRQ